MYVLIFIYNVDRQLLSRELVFWKFSTRNLRLITGMRLPKKWDVFQKMSISIFLFFFKNKAFITIYVCVCLLHAICCPWLWPIYFFNTPRIPPPNPGDPLPPPDTLLLFSTSKQVHCLRNVPWERMVTTLPPPMTATIDNCELFEHPITTMMNGKMAKVPLLTGSVTAEWYSVLIVLA